MAFSWAKSSKSNPTPAAAPKPAAGNGGGAFSWSGGTSSQPKPGGFLGTVLSAVHVVTGVASDAERYATRQAVDVGEGVGQIPSGFVSLGQAIKGTTENTAADVVAAARGESTGGVSGNAFRTNVAPPSQKKLTVATLAKATEKSYVQTAEHPQHNLFNTVTMFAPLAGGVARVGLAADAAASAEELGTAGRLGVFGKAVVHGAPTKIRGLDIPAERLVGPGEGLQGPENLVRSTERVALPTSEGSLGRVIQMGEDKVLQRGINKSIENGTTSRIGRLALRRAAGANSEVGRYTAAARNVPAVLLERADKTPDELSKPEASLAHFLRSANVTPEEWAVYSRGQAAELAGVGGKAAAKAVVSHGELARTADQLAEKGVLQMTPEGTVEVNAEQFPELARQADLQKETQAAREQTLMSQGKMTAEELQTRKNLVANQMGLEGREGQGFTSLKQTRPVKSPGLVARTVGRTLPQPKFSLGGKATGKSVQLGMIPADTLRGSAYSLREANKLQNSADLRGGLYNMGSDVRKSEDDVAVASPTGKVPDLPTDVKVLMGKLESTLSPEEEKTLRQKLDNYVQDNLLRHAPAEAVGQRAPDGWRFVNKNLIPDLLKESPGRGDTVGKYADTLNSAITSATVYTKVGHLPQRLLTNATTNFIQGGLNPVSLARSLSTAKGLTDREKLELEALTGAHASQAPLIGATSQGRVIAVGRKLAGGWAKHVDAPFRLNSLLYELRQVGYDTPDKVRVALKALQDPTRANLPGHEIMKLDGAVRRSNRAAIMYDGLNNFEKNTISRYVWFYPWTKGAIRYAGHTLTEHPVKTAILGAAGQQGLQHTKSVLGAFPTYESNLTVLGKAKSQFPLVANLSALSPYGTLADTAMEAAHPLSPSNGFVSSLNPAYGGLLKAAETGSATSAATSLVSPTPEYQEASAFLHPHGKGLLPTSQKNLFGATGESALLKSLTGGTAMPRRVNKSRLNLYAQRQHEKKRTITIYSP